MPRSLANDMLDFTGAYIRRALRGRVRGRGWIDVRRTRASSFTILHRYESNWSGRSVALPVAQLRMSGDTLRLYWRRSSGRWATYADRNEAPFAGGLRACVREIDRDPWGCFWG